MAGDAGQEVDPGARMRVQAQLRGAQFHGRIDGQRERRRAQRRRVDAQDQVVHDRVADEGQFQDLRALDAGLVRERREEPIERFADRLGQLHVATLMHHHVADPAHQVLAEADLRVHDPGARQDGAVGQVREVARDRRGTDVNGHPEGPVVETRPDRDDVATAVDGDGDPVRTLLERRLERADDCEVCPQPVETPFRAECIEQPAKIPRRGGEVGRHDIHGVESDDGVQHEGTRVQVLAHDLAVDLALRRDVDHSVAKELGRARQPPIRGKAMLGAVGRLDLAGFRQV